MLKMFEEASKLKLRYTNPRGGNMTTEDLWDLPLLNTNGSSLNEIAKALSREVKQNEEESFVVKASKANKIAELKFDIVKHVIDVKLDEIEAKENALAVKAEIEVLDEAIKIKESDKLNSQSLDKLKKMRNELKK